MPFAVGYNDRPQLYRFGGSMSGYFTPSITKKTYGIVEDSGLNGL